MFANLYNKRIKTNQKGAVFLLLVILFAAITLTLVFGMARPVLSQIGLSRTLVDSKQGLYATEGIVEDVLHRLNKTMTLPASYSIDYGHTIASVQISDTLDGKSIDASATDDGVTRNIEVDVFKGTGISFNYGIQTGTGGFEMENNAGVYGNVYANGDILGDAGAFIDGTAIAANSSGLVADQENTTNENPANKIEFGRDSSNQHFAQSFQVSSTTPLNKIQIYVRKVGNPSNRTIKIVTDNGGTPNGAVISEATLSSALMTSNFGWVEMFFPDTFSFTVGNDYWFVIEGSNHSSKYFEIAANNAYPDGVASVGEYGGSWIDTDPPGLDSAFRIYLGGKNSAIESVFVGSGGEGDARAHTVNDSIIQGSLYCQEGTGNNKVCDTSLSDPSPQGFPISEPIIEAWKLDAEDGGVINGDYVATTTGGNLGPVKIDGDLILEEDLVLSGTTWVTGNIISNNNVIISLHSGYGNGNGVLLSDGYVDLSNNVTFEGSGFGNSYVLLLTTSLCPNDTYCGGNNAVGISNNAGTVVINAQRGTIEFANNSGAKSATAEKIILYNNATISYDDGLADSNFVSGPAGAWNVEMWQETED